MPSGRRGIRIKICGLTRARDVACCVEAGADFVGFNLWSGSPRHVSAPRAEELARDLPTTTVPVAVCVDAPSVSAAISTGFEWIQVHGTSTDWRWTAADEVARTIIKAIVATEPVRLSELIGAQFYLVDTPTEHVGGSGRVFDWSRVEALAGDGRFFLAGGLNADNVADAIVTTRPYAVDVASGVESAPGIKDPERIRAFFEAVEGA